MDAKERMANIYASSPYLQAAERRTEARRKSGPKPIGPQVNFAMPTEMVAEIDRRAKRRGISRSEWVRRACEYLLDAPDKGTDQ